MKQLVLIRHAKALSSESITADIDRPLTGRGYRDAYAVSQKLKDEGLVPDLLIASVAVRTYSTALIVARWLQFPIENIVTKKALYATSVQEYLDVISEIDNKKETVFIFGHNPVISEVVSKFSQARITDLPTCTAIYFNSDANSWSEFSKSNIKVAAEIVPGHLKEVE